MSRRSVVVVSSVSLRSVSVLLWLSVSGCVSLRILVVSVSRLSVSVSVRSSVLLSLIVVVRLSVSVRNRLLIRSVVSRKVSVLVLVVLTLIRRCVM